MKNFKREDMMQMYRDFAEYEKERGFKQEEVIEDTVPAPRKVKEYDYTHVTKSIIANFKKTFEKYKEPPFPKTIHSEYVYSENELNIIMAEFQGNPYLKHRPIKGFEDIFAVEIYVDRTQKG